MDIAWTRKYLDEFLFIQTFTKLDFLSPKLY